MDWLVKFVGDFDGPAWTTLIVSVGAIIVSVVALTRTRPAKPHWELIGVQENEHEGNSPMYMEEIDDGVYPGDRYWSVRIRQSGPGIAESVITRVRTPDGNQWPERRVPDVQVGRGAELDLLLCVGRKIPGEYAVTVSYRQLPNTRKIRVWERALTLD